MDIVERLRKVDPDKEGERTRWYRNPDGPEAADEIERLRDLGLTMRNAQKKYFKERTQENLIASKQAEKAFDDALKDGE